MNLIIVDLIFLVLFLGFAGFFLYKKRKNLKQEGWLLLYRTSWGMKLIERTGKKYKKTLKVLSYISIILGFILMVAMLILIVQTVYIYMTQPQIAETLKAPPVMPLIPYFPQLFGLESMFPPFYFIYFIVAILIVATCHEFFHGIFAARYGVKIKSTGFAFLKYFPAFFGAFVEQNDKQMTKKKKFEQMSILSAGVFANILVFLIVGILFLLFFKMAFAPAGVMYNTFSYEPMNLSQIEKINGIDVQNHSFYGILGKMDDKGFNSILAENKTYIISKNDFAAQNESFKTYGGIILYDDAPAIRANFSRIIYAIDGVRVNSRAELAQELDKYRPGEEIEVTSLGSEGKRINQVVTLGENSKNSSKAWLGIGFFESNSSGIRGAIVGVFSLVKTPGTYYEPAFDGQTVVFFYDLLWWVLLINLAVALFNMLPLGFLDGGRFFYLGVLGITKSEKVAEKSFKYITYFLLLLLLALMVKWVIAFFF
ncbi:Peptidase family M50 [uncultured archaeon]|nr:Peptidase family M50 [uncultured archaeon]